ncbi:unnamed protein product, partial [Brenthis ino]
MGGVLGQFEYHNASLSPQQTARRHLAARGASVHFNIIGARGESISRPSGSGIEYLYQLFIVGSIIPGGCYISLELEAVDTLKV